MGYASLNPPKKFSLKEYEEYCRKATWELDSDRFSEETDYEDYWYATITDWVHQSQTKFDTWKKKCQNVIDDLEGVRLTYNANYDDEMSIANEPVPLNYAQVHEQVALLSANYPHPIYLPQQDSEAQYVSALNVMKDITLKMNSFQTKYIDAEYDTSIYDVAFFKTGIDDSLKGPFGQEGRITIDVLNPRFVHLDPKATRLDWEYMSYIVIDHFMELGAVRKKWPDKGYLVPESTGEYLYDEDGDRNLHNFITSPIPKFNAGETTARKMVRVRECWFKDARLKFVGDTELHINMPGTETYDPDMPLQYECPKTDSKGKVVGSWEPAYPDGRCIIIADRFVVADMPNPFLHGEAPIIFKQGSPHANLVQAGDAWRLGRLTRKFNDVLKRIMRYAQTEIERPMIADVSTFPSPRLFYETNNRSNSILVTSQGKGGTFGRIQPTEIPQFAQPLLSFLRGIMDEFSGVSGVMRGNVSDGAQLSAEALSSLQQFSSSKMKLRSEYSADSMKNLGYQLMWLIRQQYDQKITLDVLQPDGTKTSIDWEADKVTFNGEDGEKKEVLAREDYLVDIQSGTGTPGAQQQIGGLAKQLYDDNAIDQIEYLKAVKWPNPEAVVARMQEAKGKQIFTEGVGRAFGQNVRKIEKMDGQPGRKEKL